MKSGREVMMLVVAPGIFLGVMYGVLFQNGSLLPDPSSREQPPVLAGQEGAFSGSLGVAAGGEGEMAARKQADGMGQISTVPFKEAVRKNGPGQPHAGPPMSGGVSSRAPLAGQVLAPDGQPVKGARILVVVRPDLRVGIRQRTLSGPVRRLTLKVDDAGKFSFKRERGKLYEIHAEKEGFAPAAVQSIAASSPLVIRLLAAGGVQGFVLDKLSGNPLPGARLRFIGAAGVRTVTADASGFFRFRKVTPGAGVLQASHGGYQPGQTGPVRVASGQDLRQDVWLLPGLGLQGQVVKDVGGQPVAGVRVQLFDAGSKRKVFDKRTGQNGFFRPASLAAGHVYCYLAIPSQDSLASTGGCFETSQAPPFADVRIGLLPGRQVAVAVHDGEGKPLVGALIQLEARMSSVIVSSGNLHSGKDGLSAFSKLDPRASILVQVSQPGYALQTGLFQILAQEEDPLLTMIMQGELRLRGRVQDPGGHPVGGATLRISNPAQPMREQSSIYATSDEEGRFELAQLAPGNLHLVVLAPGYDSVNLQLQVGPEQPPALPIVMTPLSDR